MPAGWSAWRWPASLGLSELDLGLLAHRRGRRRSFVDELHLRHF
jgi:hypothetical protein